MVFFVVEVNWGSQVGGRRNDEGIYLRCTTNCGSTVRNGYDVREGSCCQIHFEWIAGGISLSGGQLGGIGANNLIRGFDSTVDKRGKTGDAGGRFEGGLFDLDTMAANLTRGGKPVLPGRKVAQRTCHNCEQLGYLARDCPNQQCICCGTAGHGEGNCNVKKFQVRNGGSLRKQYDASTSLGIVNEYDGHPAYSIIFSG